MAVNLLAATDGRLVKMVRDKADNGAFLEVCRRYENIFYKVCQKYSAVLSNNGVNPQDIYEEKNYIIFHCISSFNPSKKSKLGTWIGNYARYLCLNSINARKFILPTTDDILKQHIEDGQAHHDYFADTINTQEDFKYVMNILKQIQDPRVIKIFKLRYLNQKKTTWTEISEKIGLSTQTVINLHNRGLSLLRRKLQSRNISDII